jgi:hypothetical protein
MNYDKFNDVHHMWVTMQVETDTRDPHMGHDAVKVLGEPILLHVYPLRTFFSSNQFSKRMVPLGCSGKNCWK